MATNEVPRRFLARRGGPSLSQPAISHQLKATLAELAEEPFIIREPGSGTRETMEEAFLRFVEEGRWKERIGRATTTD